MNKTCFLSRLAHSLVGRQVCHTAACGCPDEVVEAAPCPPCLLPVTEVFCVASTLCVENAFPFPLLSREDHSNSGIFLLSCLCCTWDKDLRAKVAHAARIPERFWVGVLSQDSPTSRRWDGQLLEPRASEAVASLQPISVERAPPCQHRLRWWELRSLKEHRNGAKW